MQYHFSLHDEEQQIHLIHLEKKKRPDQTDRRVERDPKGFSVTSLTKMFSTTFWYFAVVDDNL